MLFTQSFGHVRHELVRADRLAGGIAERSEPHLVDAPVERRIAELVDLDELFAAERPRPHDFDRRLVCRPSVQQLQHIVTGLRAAHAKDAREFISSRRVDGEPVEIPVGDLDEDVAALDHVGEELGARRAPRPPDAPMSR